MPRIPEKLAIILVSWNTRDYLEKCLVSLYQYYDNPLAEVWVIDNASSDDSVEMLRIKFPQVRLVCNAENVGFALVNLQNQSRRNTKGYRHFKGN